MTDKQRELLELRTIAVSTRSALSHAGSTRASIIDTADALLVELQDRVISDGRDPVVMHAIEMERRAIHGEV